MYVCSTSINTVLWGFLKPNDYWQFCAVYAVEMIKAWGVYWMLSLGHSQFFQCCTQKLGVGWGNDYEASRKLEVKVNWSHMILQLLFTSWPCRPQQSYSSLESVQGRADRELGGCWVQVLMAGEERIQSDGLFDLFGRKSEDKLHKASNADVSGLFSAWY